MFVKKEELERRFSEVYPGASNTLTIIEYIRKSEKEFGLNPRKLERISKKELLLYMEELEKEWRK